jgi:hypothetical protein
MKHKDRRKKNPKAKKSAERKPVKADAKEKPLIPLPAAWER